jgi:hypothetical protein
MGAVELPGERLAIMRRGGVWVPSPLALDAGGRLLENYQCLLTLYYIRAGAKTVIPGAHTGEFAGSDLGLYARWLPLVADTVARYGGDDMFLMAAVGGRDARRQAEIAAECGYDIVMVAPTAFTDEDDDGVITLYGDIASVIPTFGFELQRAVPGSREFGLDLWLRVFEIAYGAKGASFDTYRAQVMLEAAARSSRQETLVLASGNDDRIVSDLGGRFPFCVDGSEAVMRYDAGLLGHFATDTRAASAWSRAVMAHRDGAEWALPVGERELAHYVNMCNGALFDALCGFENSVWGVKSRLTDLGLLPAPNCFHETGRAGLAETIRAAYGAHPVVSDGPWLAEQLSAMKSEIGLA